MGILWLHRQLPNAGVQTRYHTTIRKSVRSAPFESLGRQARECTDDAISALRRTLPPAHARTIGASGRSVRDMRGRHHFSCHARSARYASAKRSPMWSCSRNDRQGGLRVWAAPRHHQENQAARRIFSRSRIASGPQLEIILVCAGGESRLASASSSSCVHISRTHR